MPEDPTRLAQRLAQAAWLEMRGPAWSNWNYDELQAAIPSARMDCKARVDATVVAVLRELAADDSAWFGEQQRGYLCRLADSIEKGEG